MKLFIAIALICLLPSVFTDENDDAVPVDVLRPRSLSDDQFNEQMKAFWTKERLQQAIAPVVHFSNCTMSNNTRPANQTERPPTMYSGNSPSHRRNRTRKGRDASTPGYILTTGRVFWYSGGSYYSCSASVVTSSTQDLVLTAGHCVYNVYTRSYYVANYWVFVPGYSDGVAPYGVWTARKLLAANNWISFGDFNSDYAFAAVSKLSGISLETRVGSQGIGFNMARLALIYSFGYPINQGNGLTLQNCSSYAKARARFLIGFSGQALSCTMTNGCSGGPWIQNMNSDGYGQVTSVNSFMVTGISNTIHGPYFNSNAQTLYNRATVM